MASKWEFTPILTTYNTLALQDRQQFIDDLKSFANQLIQTDNLQSHEHTNPKYIGPGTWNVIHTLAYNAQTSSMQKNFMRTMETIVNFFPCEVCRGHSIDYLKNHPMRDYLSDALGLFVWTWKFHNHVIYRTNKQQMSWDMALHIYSQLGYISPITHTTAGVHNHTTAGVHNHNNSEVCSKECSGSEDEMSKIGKNNTINKNKKKTKKLK